LAVSRAGSTVGWTADPRGPTMAARMAVPSVAGSAGATAVSMVAVWEIHLAASWADGWAARWVACLAALTAAH
jgi:hypothetical protein